jgi:hypothetical protein
MFERGAQENTWALAEENHSEDRILDGKIILKWTSGKQGWRLWTRFIWFRRGTGGSIL